MISIDTDYAALHFELKRREAEHRLMRLTASVGRYISVPEPKSIALAEFEDASTQDLVKAALAISKGIYGVDDRMEAFSASGALANACKSVASIVETTQLQDLGSSFRLTTQTFGVARHLCTQEKFFFQPVGPFCTGFLVGEDLMVTAGHCLNASNFSTKKFVFGYRMLDSQTPQLDIPVKDIYGISALLEWRLDAAGADFALVRLDRKVADRAPLAIRRNGKVADGESLYVIGHPCGLPMKVAGGAVVTNNNAEAHFTGNLDTYGGNSGSPVFNAQTNEVEGILVRGATDFLFNGTCFESSVCPSMPNGPSCGGEDCTRITQVPSIP